MLEIRSWALRKRGHFFHVRIVPPLANGEDGTAICVVGRQRGYARTAGFNFTSGKWSLYIPGFIRVYEFPAALTPQYSCHRNTQWIEDFSFDRVRKMLQDRRKLPVSTLISRPHTARIPPAVM